MESAKMADIYEHASLTSSAIVSTGRSCGHFLASSSTSHSLPITLPEDVGACEIAVQKPTTPWEILGRSDVHARFALMSRKWAV